MHVIAIISQKGGAGKSTLARHGAVLLPSSALIDLDPQGTTARWLERRAELDDVPDVYEIPARTDQLAKARAKAVDIGCGWLVIDTPPAHDDERAVRAALDVADFALIPVQPTPDDLDAISRTLENVRRAETPFAFVLNRAKPRARMTRDARSILEKHGAVSPTNIRDLVAYSESTMSGHAVTEYEPKSRAAADMRAVWQWAQEHVYT